MLISKVFITIFFNKDNNKTHEAIYGTYGCCPGNYFDFQRMITKRRLQANVISKKSKELNCTI